MVYSKYFLDIFFFHLLPFMYLLKLPLPQKWETLGDFTEQ